MSRTNTVTPDLIVPGVVLRESPLGFPQALRQCRVGEFCHQDIPHDRNLDVFPVFAQFELPTHALGSSGRMCGGDSVSKSDIKSLGGRKSGFRGGINDALVHNLVVTEV